MGTDASFLAPVVTPDVRHLELDGGAIDVTVYPSTSTWRDHAAPRALEAAIGRCARLRFRNRHAQRSHALVLGALVRDVLRDPETAVPASLAADVAECLEGHAIDVARREQVRERVRAAIAVPAERAA